jgi:hypothetical protein
MSQTNWDCKAETVFNHQGIIARGIAKRKASTTTETTTLGKDVPAMTWANHGGALADIQGRIAGKLGE